VDSGRNVTSFVESSAASVCIIRTWKIYVVRSSETLVNCCTARHDVTGAGVVLKFEDLFQFCLKSDNSNSLVDGSHGFNSASRGKSVVQR